MNKNPNMKVQGHKTNCKQAAGISIPKGESGLPVFLSLYRAYLAK